VADQEGSPGEFDRHRRRSHLTVGIVQRIVSGLAARVGVFGGLDPEGWAIVRGEAPTVYQQTGRNVRILGWERNPVVQACVRLISNFIASVPFEVTDAPPGEGGDKIEGHALATLLESPRVAMSGHRLRGLVAVHYLLYGNALMDLERNGRRGLPSGLRLVHPEDLQFVYLDSETLEIGRYDWRDRNGATHRSGVEDMVHFRDIAGGDWLFGYPRAAAALLDISSDYEATQYVRQIVANHGSPGIVMKVAETTTNKEIRAAKKRWQEEYVQRGQRGGVAFLRGVEELQQIGFNLRDLEFPDLRAVAREDICAAFDVDPRLIGIGSARGAEGGLSGIQYVEARKRIVQQVVRPLMDALESELNLWLTPEYGNVWVRFSREELAKLTEDETELSQRMINEYRATLISREEARAVIGRDPDLDPSHTLYSGGFGSLFGELPSGNGHEPPPKQLPPGREEEEEASDQRSRFRALHLTAPQRHVLWRDFDHRASKAEDEYRRVAQSLFTEEAADIGRIFAENVPARRSTRAAGDDPFVQAALERVMTNYAPGGEYHARWLQRYGQLVTRTFALAGKQMAAEAGFSFTLENPAVQAAILQRTERLASLVTRHTAEQVMAVVGAGREAGVGMREIAGMINEAIFESQAPQRSVVIARTETIGALNQGEYETARAAGIFAAKEWLTQGDDRVREEHEDLDRMRVPIDADFTPGLAFPGDGRAGPEQVIQCRCTLLYHT